MKRRTLASDLHHSGTTLEGLTSNQRSVIFTDACLSHIPGQVEDSATMLKVCKGSEASSGHLTQVTPRKLSGARLRWYVS